MTREGRERGCRFWEARDIQLYLVNLDQQE
jgi:hypothetical protein